MKMAPISLQHQRGAALITSLLILVIMTLIGVTGMQTTTLEEKMAGNMHDRNLAFQAAEAALRDAEQNFIETLIVTSSFNGTKGLYGKDNPEPSDLLASSVWSSTNSRAYSQTTFPGVATPPRYIVKILNVRKGKKKHLNIKGYGSQLSSSDVTVFSITARGTGGSDQSQVILRSRYGKLF